METGKPSKTVQRKLRMGMVGGGPGALIGPVHAMAAQLDGKIELVAGAFSSFPERSIAAGKSYRLEPNRVYASYEEMFRAEKLRTDAIDFVTIVTPNHLHLPVATAALVAGFPVMSDKPATKTYEEALKLERVVENARLPYALSHTYAGYSLVREARSICQHEELGDIRKVIVEYLQGWLSQPIEQAGNKQASWRSDPNLSGPGGAITDIGTHAFHLLEYVTGLQIVSMYPSLRSVVPGRKVDDDSEILLRLNNGAGGTLVASQIATGEANQLGLRIYGEHASLTWRQEEPNRLHIRWSNGREEIRHAAGEYLSRQALQTTRLPGGHPEGFIEAFANLYSEFADVLLAKRSGGAYQFSETLPGIHAGIRGMRFVEQAIAGSRLEQWMEI